LGERNEGGVKVGRQYHRKLLQRGKKGSGPLKGWREKPEIGKRRTATIWKNGDVVYTNEKVGGKEGNIKNVVRGKATELGKSWPKQRERSGRGNCVRIFGKRVTV